MVLKIQVEFDQQIAVQGTEPLSSMFIVLEPYLPGDTTSTIPDYSTDATATDEYGFRTDTFSHLGQSFTNAFEINPTSYQIQGKFLKLELDDYFEPIYKYIKKIHFFYEEPEEGTKIVRGDVPAQLSKSTGLATAGSEGIVQTEDGTSNSDLEPKLPFEIEKLVIKDDESDKLYYYYTNTRTLNFKNPTTNATIAPSNITVSNFLTNTFVESGQYYDNSTGQSQEFAVQDTTTNDITSVINNDNDKYFVVQRDPNTGKLTEKSSVAPTVSQATYKAEDDFTFPLEVDATNFVVDNQIKNPTLHAEIISSVGGQGYIAVKMSKDAGDTYLNMVGITKDEQGNINNNDSDRTLRHGSSIGDTDTAQHPILGSGNDLTVDATEGTNQSDPYSNIGAINFRFNFTDPVTNNLPTIQNIVNGEELKVEVDTVGDDIILMRLDRFPRFGIDYSIDYSHQINLISGIFGPNGHAVLNSTAHNDYSDTITVSNYLKEVKGTVGKFKVYYPPQKPTSWATPANNFNGDDVDYEDFTAYYYVDISFERYNDPQSNVSVPALITAKYNYDYTYQTQAGHNIHHGLILTKDNTTQNPQDGKVDEEITRTTIRDNNDAVVYLNNTSFGTKLRIELPVAVGTPYTAGDEDKYPYDTTAPQGSQLTNNNFADLDSNSKLDLIDREKLFDGASNNPPSYYYINVMDSLGNVVSPIENEALETDDDWGKATDTTGNKISPEIEKAEYEAEWDSNANPPVWVKKVKLTFKHDLKDDTPSNITSIMGGAIEISNDGTIVEVVPAAGGSYTQNNNEVTITLGEVGSGGVTYKEVSDVSVIYPKTNNAAGTLKNWLGFDISDFNETLELANGMSDLIATLNTPTFQHLSDEITGTFTGRLTWTKSSGSKNGLFYRVEYSTMQTFTPATTTVAVGAQSHSGADGDDQTYDIAGLSYNTDYYFRVVGINFDEGSPAATSSAFSQSPPADNSPPAYVTNSDVWEYKQYDLTNGLDANWTTWNDTAGGNPLILIEGAQIRLTTKYTDATSCSFIDNDDSSPEISLDASDYYSPGTGLSFQTSYDNTNLNYINQITYEIQEGDDATVFVFRFKLTDGTNDTAEIQKTLPDTYSNFFIDAAAPSINTGDGTANSDTRKWEWQYVTGEQNGNLTYSNWLEYGSAPLFLNEGDKIKFSFEVDEMNMPTPLSDLTKNVAFKVGTTSLQGTPTTSVTQQGTTSKYDVEIEIEIQSGDPNGDIVLTFELEDDKGNNSGTITADMSDGNGNTGNITPVIDTSPPQLNTSGYNNSAYKWEWSTDNGTNFTVLSTAKTLTTGDQIKLTVYATDLTDVIGEGAQICFDGNFGTGTTSAVKSSISPNSVSGTQTSTGSTTPKEFELSFTYTIASGDDTSGDVKIIYQLLDVPSQSNVYQTNATPTPINGDVQGELLATAPYTITIDTTAPTAPTSSVWYTSDPNGFWTIISNATTISNNKWIKYEFTSTDATSVELTTSGAKLLVAGSEVTSGVTFQTFSAVLTNATTNEYTCEIVAELDNNNLSANGVIEFEFTLTDSLGNDATTTTTNSQLITLDTTAPNVPNSSSISWGGSPGAIAAQVHLGPGDHFNITWNDTDVASIDNVVVKKVVNGTATDITGTGNVTTPEVGSSSATATNEIRYTVPANADLEIESSDSVTVEFDLTDSFGNTTTTAASFSNSNINLDNKKPSFSEAEIDSTSATLLAVTLSEDIKSTGFSASDFSVIIGSNSSNPSQASISATDSSVIELTLSSGAQAGDTVTVSYTKPNSGGVEDLAGNLLDSFSGQSVTNNAPDNQPPNLTGTVDWEIDTGSGYAQVSADTTIGPGDKIKISFSASDASTPITCTCTDIIVAGTTIGTGADMASGTSPDFEIEYTVPASVSSNGTFGFTNIVLVDSATPANSNTISSLTNLNYTITLDTTPPSNPGSVTWGTTINQTAGGVGTPSYLAEGDKFDITWTDTDVASINNVKVSYNTSQSNSATVIFDNTTGSTTTNYGSLSATTTGGANKIEYTVPAAQSGNSGINLHDTVSVIIEFNITDSVGNITSTAASFSNSNIRMDNVKPTYSSSSVETATPSTISVTLSEAIKSTGFSASDFSVTIGSNSSNPSQASISGTDSSVIELTLGSAVTTGQSVTVLYTKPSSGGVEDLAGNLLDTFSQAETVSNNVSDSTPPSISFPSSGDPLSKDSGTGLFDYTEGAVVSLLPGKNIALKLTIEVTDTESPISTVAVSDSGGITWTADSNNGSNGDTYEFTSNSISGLSNTATTGNGSTTNTLTIQATDSANNTTTDNTSFSYDLNKYIWGDDPDFTSTGNSTFNISLKTGSDATPGNVGFEFQYFLDPLDTQTGLPTYEAARELDNIKVETSKDNTFASANIHNTLTWTNSGNNSFSFFEADGGTITKDADDAAFTNSNTTSGYGIGPGEKYVRVTYNWTDSNGAQSASTKFIDPLATNTTHGTIVRADKPWYCVVDISGTDNGPWNNTGSSFDASDSPFTLLLDNYKPKWDQTGTSKKGFYGSYKNTVSAGFAFNSYFNTPDISYNREILGNQGWNSTNDWGEYKPNNTIGAANNDGWMFRKDVASKIGILEPAIKGYYMKGSINPDPLIAGVIVPGGPPAYTYDYSHNIIVRPKTTGDYEEETNTIQNSSNTNVGTSCALSGDGYFMIVGDPTDSTNTGKVYIREKSGGSWVDRGTLTNATNNEKEYGYRVAINFDGSVIAVTMKGDSNLAGCVYVYDRGDLNTSNTPNDYSWTLRESSSGIQSLQDGKLLAGYLLGASDLVTDGYFTSMNEAWESGRVNQNNGPSNYTSESQATGNSDNILTQNGDEFGTGLSISDDGKWILAGAPKSDTIRINEGGNQTFNETGVVTLFYWDGTDWIQKGNSLRPEKNVLSLPNISLGVEEYAHFGTSVSISNTSGSEWCIFMVGAPGDSTQNVKGWVDVYKFEDYGTNSGSIGLFKQVDAVSYVTPWDPNGKTVGSNTRYSFTKSIPSPNLSYEAFGTSVSCNKNAGLRTYAIGAPAASGQGTFHVFDWNYTLNNNNGGYTQHSNSNFGSSTGSKFGYNVKFDHSGRFLLVSAPYQEESGTTSGYCKIYKRKIMSGTATNASSPSTSRIWIPVKDVNNDDILIQGNSNVNSGRGFGVDVSISMNGKDIVVASSSKANNSSTSNDYYVKTYSFDSDQTGVGKNEDSLIDNNSLMLIHLEDYNSAGFESTDKIERYSFTYEFTQDEMLGNTTSADYPYPITTSIGGKKLIWSITAVSDYSRDSQGNELAPNSSEHMWSDKIKTTTGAEYGDGVYQNKPWLGKAYVPIEPFYTSDLTALPIENLSNDNNVFTDHMNADNNKIGYYASSNNKMDASANITTTFDDWVEGKQIFFPSGPPGPPDLFTDTKIKLFMDLSGSTGGLNSASLKTAEMLWNIKVDSSTPSGWNFVENNAEQNPSVEVTLTASDLSNNTWYQSYYKVLNNLSASDLSGARYPSTAGTYQKFLTAPGAPSLNNFVSSDPYNYANYGVVSNNGPGYHPQPDGRNIMFKITPASFTRLGQSSETKLGRATTNDWHKLHYYMSWGIVQPWSNQSWSTDTGFTKTSYNRYADDLVADKASGVSTNLTYFGHKVASDKTGNIILASARDYQANWKDYPSSQYANHEPYVQSYIYSDGAWKKRGDPIWADGTTSSDRSSASYWGYAISMNEDGDFIVVGAEGCPSSGITSLNEDRGYIKMLKWDSNATNGNSNGISGNWVQFGKTVHGSDDNQGLGERLGCSVDCIDYTDTNNVANRVVVAGANAKSVTNGITTVLRAGGVYRYGVIQTASTHNVTVTVNNGVYVFTESGSAWQPADSVRLGDTIKFDVSATQSSHPLAFSTTSDGTHGGGSAWLGGSGSSYAIEVSGPDSDNIITVFVKSVKEPDATSEADGNWPSNFYYYCTQHSNMGGELVLLDPWEEYAIDEEDQIGQTGGPAQDDYSGYKLSIAYNPSADNGAGREFLAVSQQRLAFGNSQKDGRVVIYSLGILGGNVNSMSRKEITQEIYNGGQITNPTYGFYLEGATVTTGSELQSQSKLGTSIKLKITKRGQYHPQYTTASDGYDIILVIGMPGWNRHISAANAATGEGVQGTYNEAGVVLVFNYKETVATDGAFVADTAIEKRRIVDMSGNSGTIISTDQPGYYKSSPNNSADDLFGRVVDIATEGNGTYTIFASALNAQGFGTNHSNKCYVVSIQRSINSMGNTSYYYDKDYVGYGRLTNSNPDITPSFTANASDGGVWFQHSGNWKENFGADIACGGNPFNLIIGCPHATQDVGDYTNANINPGTGELVNDGVGHVIAMNTNRYKRILTNVSTTAQKVNDDEMEYKWVPENASNQTRGYLSVKLGIGKLGKNPEFDFTIPPGVEFNVSILNSDDNGTTYVEGPVSSVYSNGGKEYFLPVGGSYIDLGETQNSSSAPLSLSSQDSDGKKFLVEGQAIAVKNSLAFIPEDGQGAGRKRRLRISYPNEISNFWSSDTNYSNLELDERGLTTFNNEIYFTAKDNTHTSLKIWKCDVPADFYTNAPSATLVYSTNVLDTSDYYPFFGKWRGLNQSVEYEENSTKYLYFFAEDSAGRQLWRTNGTNSGTTRVKVINSSHSCIGYDATNSGGATDHVAASNGIGTETDMYHISTTGSNATSLIYFRASSYDPANSENIGYELWQSDGTSAGTRMVTWDGTNGQQYGIGYDVSTTSNRNQNKNWGIGSWSPNIDTNNNNATIKRSSTASDHQPLLEQNREQTEVILFDNKVFYAGWQGGTTPTNGANNQEFNAWQLWCYDPSSDPSVGSGTPYWINPKRISNINAPSSIDSQLTTSFKKGLAPKDLTVLGNDLYFTGNTSFSSNVNNTYEAETALRFGCRHIWKCSPDSNASSGYTIARISEAQHADNSSVEYGRNKIIAYKGKLYACLVKAHIYTGGTSSSDGANFPDAGAELWSYDPTKTATEEKYKWSIVANLYTGFDSNNNQPYGSYPYAFKVFDDTLFFVARTDGPQDKKEDGQYQLWQTDGTPEGTFMVADPGKKTGTDWTKRRGFPEEAYMWMVEVEGGSGYNNKLFFPANGYDESATSLNGTSINSLNGGNFELSGIMSTIVNN